LRLLVDALGARHLSCGHALRPCSTPRHARHEQRRQRDTRPHARTHRIPRCAHAGPARTHRHEQLSSACGKASPALSCTLGARVHTRHTVRCCCARVRPAHCNQLRDYHHTHTAPIPRPARAKRTKRGTHGRLAQLLRSTVLSSPWQRRAPVAVMKRSGAAAVCAAVCLYVQNVRWRNNLNVNKAFVT
jgi:hypothetical protein